MKLSRRGVLAGAAVGGGLLVAWSFVPREFDNPLDPAPGEIAFDAWLKIADDGVVTVAVPQLEMGQGVTTLLPQIVALELGADWRQVAVEPAPVSGAYANVPLAALWAPLWRPLVSALADEPDDALLRRWAQDERFAVTAKGTTLAAYEAACRNAAASARAMLAMAAADQWDVPWEQCTAEAGFIVHDNRRASFADLALAAARFDPPDPPPLNASPPAEHLVAADEDFGEATRELAFPRLDLPSKVDGSFTFAADVRLPDMVYAAIRHAPLAEGELLDFDAAPAARIAGIVQLVRSKRWLAAIGETWWAAERALEAINPQFAMERPVDSDEIRAALDTALRSGSSTLVDARGAGEADYAPNVALRYDVAPGLHATIETSSATARLADGVLELWLPTQAPEAARRAAAKALGISTADVVLYPVAAGGSFDRRLEHGIAITVALLAREARRPVQLTWSRRQEQGASFPRAPAAGLVGAQVDEAGNIAQVRALIATPPTMHEFGRRLFDNSTPWAAMDDVAGRADPMAVAGFMPAYGIPAIAVRHVPVQLALPTAPMRGSADAVTCFMRESFIDEVAGNHGREPLSYRVTMLGQEPRLADCLQRAARLAQWDGGRAGTGQGIACHVMQLGEAVGRIAVVAEAGIGEGGVRVRALFACVDIGRVINRDIALQQIEGGLIFGLGLATGCAGEYADGVPVNPRLAALALPTLENAPQIMIDLVESEAEPFDPGEIGVPCVAPAVANALFSATGLRTRRLPLLTAPA